MRDRNGVMSSQYSQEKLRTIKELTLEDLRRSGQCLFTFTDDEWAKVSDALTLAGSNYTDERNLRRDIPSKIDEILRERETIENKQKMSETSKKALLESRRLAAALAAKLLEITEIQHKMILIGSPDHELHRHDSPEDIIERRFVALFMRLAKLFYGSESALKSPEVGRPVDWFTLHWCSVLSSYLGERCGVPQIDARGKVDSKMVMIVNLLWTITKPSPEMRDNRRAIQAGLKKVQLRRQAQIGGVKPSGLE